jgi:formate hydrogenlyase subunit 3/multisubunit Na+/H+ antiporter MnhD subunit
MNIWGRLGISVAIVSIFAIVMTEVLQDTTFYQVYRWAICAVLLGMGAFLFVVGRFVNAKIRESRRHDSETPQGPFLLVNLEYWGLMLTVFAMIVIFIVPHQTVQARESRAAVSKPAIARKVAPPATNEPSPPIPPEAVPVKPVGFPQLKLQGVAYKQTNASALINGRTYFVGDRIGETKLVSITETNVVVEWQGQRRELQLSD